jgi:hypothetical protein
MENCQSAGSHHQCWVIFVCVFLQGRGGKGFFWLFSLDIGRVELFKFCFLKRIYVQEWVR